MANEEPKLLAGPQGEEEQFAKFTSRDFLYILFRHKWKIAIIFPIISIFGFFIALLLPPVYESTAELLVKSTRGVSGDEGIDLPTGAASLGPYAALSSVSILESRATIALAVDRIGPERLLQKPEPRPFIAAIQKKLAAFKPEEKPEPIPPEMQKRYAVQLVQSNLSVRNRGNIIIAQLGAANPELAQETLDTLLEIYMDRHIEVHKAQVSQAFYLQDVEAKNEALRNKQDELQEFRSLHNITSLDQQMENLLASISETRASIQDVETQMRATRARIQDYERQLGEMTKSVASAEGEADTAPAITSAAISPMARELSRRLLDLRIELEQLRNRYPEGTRPIQDQLAEIRVVEEELKKTQSGVAMPATGDTGQSTPVYADNPAQSNILIALVNERAQLTGLAARREALQEALPPLKKELSQLESVEKKLRRLMQEEGFLQEAYLRSLNNLERAKLAQRLNEDRVSNVSVIQAASRPINPTKPDRKRIFALAILMGLASSIGLAFALEYLDQTLKTGDDVKRYIGVPVLATVSRKGYKSCT